VARELMRREEKNKEIKSRARNHVYTKTKTKEDGIGGRKDRERCDWIAITFEETIHWRRSFYK